MDRADAGVVPADGASLGADHFFGKEKSKQPTALCRLALTPIPPLYIIKPEMKRGWNPSYVGRRLCVSFMTGLF